MPAQLQLNPDGSATCHRGHTALPYVRRATGRPFCSVCHLLRMRARYYHTSFASMLREAETYHLAERKRALAASVNPEAHRMALCASCADVGILVDGSRCPDCAEYAAQKRQRNDTC